MVLISIKSFVTFLCPHGINIFIALLVGIVVPKIVSVAFFDLFVFFPVVPLARNLRKTGINNFTFVKFQTFIVQVNLELVEQVFYNCHLHKFLAERPDCHFVWHLITGLKSQKILKAVPVNNLVFNLMVPKVVIALEQHDFEHDNNSERFCTCIVLLVGVKHLRFQQRSKILKINYFTNGFQRAA